MFRYVLCLMFVLGHVLKADTIVVSVPGHLNSGGYPIFIGFPEASSWSSTVTYTGVSIAALLVGPGSRPVTGTAYLTTRIGPGTTTANEIARTNFLFPAQTGLVPLFSNLTLPPDTYYFVIGSSETVENFDAWLDAFSCDASGFMCVPPTVTVGPGVSRNGDFRAGNSYPAYTPAADFFQGVGERGGDPFLDYEVFVPEPSSIPEPSPLSLLSVGLMFFLAVAIRRMRFRGQLHR